MATSRSGRATCEYRSVVARSACPASAGTAGAGGPRRSTPSSDLRSVPIRGKISVENDCQDEGKDEMGEKGVHASAGYQA
jgi:hypothetical protein